MEPVEVTEVRFSSADGPSLRGDLLAPAEPNGTAVICHPHPLYGGTRHDAVVAALSRAFVGVGRRVLRFDFRGAGDSEGNHDGGDGERDDLRAAIEFLDPEDGPLTIAGYSFGADVALSVEHPAADRWIVVAPPLAIVAPAELIAAADPRPVDIFVAADDQFNPPDQLMPSISTWISTTTHVVEPADHFFGGAHAELTERVGALLVTAADGP